MKLIPINHNTTKVVLNNIDDFTNNYKNISLKAIKTLVAYYHKHIDTYPDTETITHEDVDILHTPDIDNRNINVVVNKHQTPNIIAKYSLWKYERNWQTIKPPLLHNTEIPLTLDLYTGTLDVIPHTFNLTIAFN